MPSIESTIKSQYAKFFTQDDWRKFKLIAQYYLKIAVNLKKKDIDAEECLKLLLRNAQKRLFIGIACELLLKSFFLKKGYCINKPIKKQFGTQAQAPYRLADIKESDFKADDTYTLDFFIEKLSKVNKFRDHSAITQGFKIAKVFRNKEAHVATYQHKFNSSNYSDIENSLIQFFEEAFNEVLNIRFSMEPNEKAIFKIRKLV